MSLILAFRTDTKVYFMSDRRILSGYAIARDQPKMLTLSSRKDGHASDIVIGVCGEVRMMTILGDPRIQAKILQAYNQTPTIWGLIDALRESFVANGIKPEDEPGGASRFVLGLLIGIDSELYDVSRTLTIIRVPQNELCAVGSGSEPAYAFWAGAHSRHVVSCIGLSGCGHSGVRKPAEEKSRLQAVFNYVSTVDSCVSANTDFYSYDLHVFRELNSEQK
jgi:hypothetical protein